MKSVLLHFFPHKDNGHRPHVLAHRHLAATGFLLVAFKMLAFGSLVIWPKHHAASQAITSTAITTLTNESRRESKLNELVTNPQLTHAAQDRADDMLAENYFSHESPTGKQAWDFMKASGYPFTIAGENLAIHYTQAEDVTKSWMLSPKHRENILESRYTDIGIGIAHGVIENQPSIVVVQLFGSTAPQSKVGPLHFLPGRSIAHAASTHDIYGAKLPFAKFGSTANGIFTLFIIVLTGLLTCSLLAYAVERKTHHGHPIIIHAMGIIGTGIILALW